MLFIDYPTIHDRPANAGSIVVLSLDPVASVEDLNDEEATREAAAITPTRCLAVIRGVGEFVFSRRTAGANCLTYRFVLAGRGLPDRPASWAAIPIAPAPAIGELPALPMHPPLPWDDCYVHPLQVIAARVSRVYQHPRAGPSFARAEHSRLRTLVSEFNEENNRRNVESGSLVLPSTSSEGPVVDYSQPDSVPQYESGDSEDIFPDIYDRSQKLKVYVHLWTNVWDVGEELGCPEQLHADIERLKDIERRWAERTVAAMLSKRPQTTAWLAGTAGADAPPSPTCDDEVTSNEDEDEDDSIAPEDAIEHRSERRADSEAARASHSDVTSLCISQSSSGLTASSTSSSPAKHVWTSYAAFGGTKYLTDTLTLAFCCLWQWSIGFAPRTLATAFRSFFWSLLWRRPFSE